MTERLDVDRYLMDLACAAAARSTCARLRVGAVLAVRGRVASTGYNGAPAGIVHCDCEPGGDRPCDAAVHAEANALIFAGTTTHGATLYVTHAPCRSCAGLVVNAGVRRVVYGLDYRSTRGLELLATAGIPAEKVEPFSPVTPDLS